MNMRRYGRVIIVIMLVIAAIAVAEPRFWRDSGKWHHAVRQAEAFVHGRFDLDEYFADVTIYHDADGQGKYYVIFPPLPAVLLVPLVAVFGVQTRTALVSLLLTVLNFVLLRRIFRQLDVDERSQWWLLAATLLGTAYWPTLLHSYTAWDFAHIVAVTCMLLGVHEVLGKARGPLAGLYCGLAVLSRHLCVYSAVFFVVALWQQRRDRPRREMITHMAAFGAVLGGLGALYLAFNWARFGDPLETGYRFLSPGGFLGERVRQYGLFDLAYVPFNLAYMFLQGFHIDFGGPTLLQPDGMNPFGTSITFASPFVFVALLARWRRPLLWAAWFSVAAPLVHMAFYYNNGWEQVNAQRFTLDFLPVLIVLVALGRQRLHEKWWRAAIVYSIALNALATLIVPTLCRLMER